MFSLFHWVTSYWTVLIWAVPILIGCAVLRFYLGSKLSLPALVAGGAFIIFILGRKIERDNSKKIAQDIEDKREKEYEKIDRRNTSVSDVAGRLHDGNF